MLISVPIMVGSDDKLPVSDEQLHSNFTDFKTSCMRVCYDLSLASFLSCYFGNAISAFWAPLSHVSC